MQDPITKNTRALLERFEACGKAALLLYDFECSLFDAKILSESKMYDHIPALERTLLELASDEHLTTGVLYSLTITTTIENKSKNSKLPVLLSTTGLLVLLSLLF